MGMVYSAVMEQIAVSALQDLFQITAPADSIVELISVVIGQSSDFGDAAAEGLPIQITKYATGGSGGTLNIAAPPHEDGFPTKGSTVDRNNTTQGGTPTVVHADTFNIQAGWQYKPIPEERHTISPGGIIAVELPVAPADAITMTATITFEEKGG